MDGVLTGAWVLSGGIDNQQNISLFGGIGRSTFGGSEVAGRSSRAQFSFSFK